MQTKQIAEILSVSLQAYGMQPPAPGVQPGPYAAVPQPAQPGQYGGTAGQFGQQPPPGVQSASLWVGFEAVPEFNIVQRLKGPNGAYLQHIEKESGASVALRGRGSGVQVHVCSSPDACNPEHTQLRCHG